MATDLACKIPRGETPFENMTVWALNVIYKRGMASVHKITIDFDNKISEIVSGYSKLDMLEAINRFTGVAFPINSALHFFLYLTGLLYTLKGCTSFWLTKGVVQADIVVLKFLNIGNVHNVCELACLLCLQNR